MCWTCCARWLDVSTVPWRVATPPLCPPTTYVCCQQTARAADSHAHSDDAIRKPMDCSCSRLRPSFLPYFYAIKEILHRIWDLLGFYNARPLSDRRIFLVRWDLSNVAGKNLVFGVGVKPVQGYGIYNANNMVHKLIITESLNLKKKQQKEQQQKTFRQVKKFLEDVQLVLTLWLFATVYYT